jgi:hypothetical protein
MEFPNPYRNGSGTPIIGQQQIPVVTFQVQLTEELMNDMKPFAEETGLEGASLLSYVFNRGLAAIRGDLQYAKEERDALRDKEGTTPE